MPDQLYDNTKPESIEKYAKRLIGHTFLDVLNNGVGKTSAMREDTFQYGNARRGRFVRGLC